MSQPAKSEDWKGLCIYDDSSVLIRLRSGDSDESTEDTLLEEWSHALRSECPVPIEDEHDQLFWAILARISLHWRGE